jgi:RNA polymerase sigma-70 factor, ECF subfamily
MKNPTLEVECAAGDTILMHELSHRKPEALDRLYRRYESVLRGVIVRVMGDAAETDDVLQDVFLQAWSRADHYSADKGKPLGWLITMARRRAIDRLRQRGAYQRARDRFELECEIPLRDGEASRSVETEACRDDLRKHLSQLLHRLPPRQKQVVELAFFKGLSQRDIAAALELPLGTVKTRIELGLRKLAKVVGRTAQKVA